MHPLFVISSYHKNALKEPLLSHQQEVALRYRVPYTADMLQSDNICLFCTISATEYVMENELAYAIWDAFPVTPLHALIIPKRHAVDWFSLTEEEITACNNLIRQLRKLIQEQDPLVSGFTIGSNVGKASGQTIFHCHIHLIPRREGDVADPRGGIRHIIPGKGFYPSDQEVMNNR